MSASSEYDTLPQYDEEKAFGQRTSNMTTCSEEVTSKDTTGSKKSIGKEVANELNALVALFLGSIGLFGCLLLLHFVSKVR